MGGESAFTLGSLASGRNAIVLLGNHGGDEVGIGQGTLKPANTAGLADGVDVRERGLQGVGVGHHAGWGGATAEGSS